MADKVLCMATNEGTVADHPVSSEILGCAVMDAKFEADEQIVPHDIMEEQNATKLMHQRLAEQTDGTVASISIPADHPVSLKKRGCAAMDAKLVAQNAKTFRDRIPSISRVVHHLSLKKVSQKRSGRAEMVPSMDAAMDAKFVAQHAENIVAQNDEIGSRDIMEKPNGTKSMDRILAEQTDGDKDSSSLRLYQQLYGYATQGKIDRFKDTIERELEANARDRLLSRLSPRNNTLLHIAAKFGHAKLAAEILQHHKCCAQRKRIAHGWWI